MSDSPTSGPAPDSAAPDATRAEGPAATRAEPPPSRTEELSGRFGRYEIERLLGRGGMGAVYLARQTDLDRPVVVLRVPQGLPDRAERARRGHKLEMRHKNPLIGIFLKLCVAELEHDEKAADHCEKALGRGTQFIRDRAQDVRRARAQHTRPRPDVTFDWDLLTQAFWRTIDTLAPAPKK